MFLLDTHTWIWLAGRDKRLRASLRRRLEREPLFISAASVFEMTQLVRLGRYRLRESPQSWLDKTTLAYAIDVVPIDERIGLRAGDLANTLGDPIDCLIAGTALINDLQLVTVDETLQSLPMLRTVW